jgi:hypothetical protein
MCVESVLPAINEQNPPPHHVEQAEHCQRMQQGILLSCMAILIYLLIALDSQNLLLLLLVLIFMASPLTAAFFMVDRKIKYWEKPYQLYSQEFSYRPKLKSGVQVPIHVEYQFPTSVTTPEILDRIHEAAESGISRFFSAFQMATDYEETRRLFVQILTPEIEKLGIDIFRIHILKIHFPASQEYYTLTFEAPRSMAAHGS